MLYHWAQTEVQSFKVELLYTVWLYLFIESDMIVLNAKNFNVTRYMLPEINV